MPGYRGHITGAFIVWVVGLTGVLFLRYVSGLQAVMWCFSAIIGGLFPDLDIKSMGQKWLFRALFIIGIVLIFNECYRFMSVMMLIATIPLLVRHRGLLHSLAFISGVTLASSILLCAQFSNCQEMILSNALFFWLGAVSHLLLDGHGIFAGYKRFRFLTKMRRRLY